MRVLGIDASLRSTGYGVVESRGSRWVCLEAGLVRNPASRLHSECLAVLQRELGAVIARTQPQAAAIEGGFYFKNARTALVLGEARGVLIATCAAAGLPVFEYAPRRVKQSLTGAGAAGKDQVAKMVCRVLGLTEPPPEDAADALAIALCHLHGQTGVAALQPKPI